VRTLKRKPISEVKPSTVEKGAKSYAPRYGLSPVAKRIRAASVEAWGKSRQVELRPQPGDAEDAR